MAETEAEGPLSAWLRSQKAPGARIAQAESLERLAMQGAANLTQEGRRLGADSNRAKAARDRRAWESEAKLILEREPFLRPSDVAPRVQAYCCERRILRPDGRSYSVRSIARHLARLRKRSAR